MMDEKSHSRLRFGMWYDFRNPPAWRRPYDDLYGEVLDQIVWGEQNGFDDIWLSEHHFCDDGYSPSLLPIAAAIAARTKKIRIITGVILMPFHNPIRLAEDCATVDVISRGRFELGAAVGYKVEEFEGFAIPFKQRGGRTDEGLEIVRRLLQGETVSFKGKYYELNRAKITPEPIQKPNPPIWIGGFTPPAMKRAAKYGDGFMGPPIPLRALYDLFVEERRKLGKSTDNLMVAGGYDWLILSNDPEKTWREAAPHVIYQVNNYAKWMKDAGMTAEYTPIRDEAHLRQVGNLRVLDAAGCIKMIRQFLDQVPLSHYVSWTVPPGLPAKWSQPHLELFVKHVIPAFRQ